MCWFILVVAKTDDDARVSAVMTRHGRLAVPIQGTGIARVLLPGERVYYTTPGHCDCGTVLAPRSPRDPEADYAKDAVRRRRQGWSEAKIQRAIEAKRAADARPQPPGIDTIADWAAVIGDLVVELGRGRVGLLLHFGNVEEDYPVSRRDLPADRPLATVLQDLNEDEITLFHSA